MTFYVQVTKYSGFLCVRGKKKPNALLPLPGGPTKSQWHHARRSSGKMWGHNHSGYISSLVSFLRNTLYLVGFRAFAEKLLNDCKSTRGTQAALTVNIALLRTNVNIILSLPFDIRWKRQIFSFFLFTLTQNVQCTVVYSHQFNSGGRFVMWLLTLVCLLALHGCWCKIKRKK